MRAGLQLALFGRITLATAFGFLIGLERQWRGKPAGDRTFALLALGASAFAGLALGLFPDSADRVIQGVVTGVGFLGAGIIFQTHERPQGLTTAAAAWAATGIGVLCGVTLYVTAGLTTILTILVLESISLPGVSRLETPPTEPSDPERED